MTGELFEKRLEIHKDRTLPDATEEAYKVGLPSTVHSVCVVILSSVDPSSGGHGFAWTISACQI